MRGVESRLAEWRSLYGALVTAELKLREARAGRGSPEWTAELESAVLRLRDESARALEALDAALAGGRASHEST